jgi:hypothetical protein
LPNRSGDAPMAMSENDSDPLAAPVRQERDV